MPHIVIEYSEGAGSRIDMQALVEAVHRSVRDSGAVKPNAVRTFAREATHSLVADEHPDNQFVQIILRIAPGRSAAEKRAILQIVYSAAEGIARPALDGGRCAYVPISSNRIPILRSTRPHCRNHSVIRKEEE